MLGRTNELFAKRVPGVACGTWPTELPEGVEGLSIPATRCAARCCERAGAPYITPGDYPMSILLIFGGSQGARVMSDIVPRALEHLPEDLRGRLTVSPTRRATADADEVRAAYDDDGRARGHPAVF